MSYDYEKQKNIKNRQQAKNLACEMPSFLNDYLLAKAASTASSTQLSYTYDIIQFIWYWHDSVPEFADKDIKQMSAEDFAKVTPQDINEYLYSLDSTQNSKTLARKCTALASLFGYMTNMGYIEINPMGKVERPKIRKDYRIIRLENDEMRRLFDAIENGCPSMPERQRKYLEHTKVRDLAITMLLLGTGIRVSECVGLDIDDIFIPSHKMQITRKGGKKQTLALGDEVIKALSDYLIVRETECPEAPADKNALFLSTRKTRMSVAAIENMVTKYTNALGFGKRITPHKLRKTYGTNLYNETRDIYLVANALGHESVNTTTQHYVASREEDLQDVRNLIKLKEENEHD